jgi:peptidoglycan-associated lipoprotein
MRKKLWICLALLVVIPGLLFVGACARTTVETTEEPMEEVEAAEQPAQPETTTEAAAEQPTEQPAEEMAEAYDPASRNMFLSEYVHFAFDKYNLDDLAQAVLQRKANFLRDNPDIYITIEGHCDERGTNEYNLALGDRRSESTRSFLLDLGIEAYRISTVSYGEERPLCEQRNEECWSTNRRAAFIIN